MEGRQAIPQNADRATCLGLNHDAFEGSKIASLFKQRPAGRRALERLIKITPRSKTRLTWHTPYTNVARQPRQRYACSFSSPSFAVVGAGDCHKSPLAFLWN